MYGYYSWEIALNVVLDVYHSVPCRTRKEYGTKQRKLIVRKIIEEMMGLTGKFLTPAPLVRINTN
jgi:hypothetical protein